MNCPVCESKVNKLKNGAPKGQTTIDDYIDGQNDGDAKFVN
ncbi:hypothetical protein [Bacillus sp. CRN 9]